ncbi:MAG: hypothetical protein K0Q59_457 [Paenibacillus sp.]|jgi:hypothetical protein|nr:hypothetical protein [Paenibacillus sp.]
MSNYRFAKLAGIVALAAFTALSAGCSKDDDKTVKQQQLHQRDDTQGGTGNKTHSGNLE